MTAAATAATPGASPPGRAPATGVAGRRASPPSSVAARRGPRHRAGVARRRLEVVRQLLGLDVGPRRDRRSRSSSRSACPGWCSACSSAPRCRRAAPSYQGVFRNPLADPYLLGAAAGAGLGVTIVIVGAADELDHAQRRRRWPPSSARWSPSRCRTCSAPRAAGGRRPRRYPGGGRRGQLPHRRCRPTCSSATRTRSARCTRGSSAACPPPGGTRCASCCRTRSVTWVVLLAHRRVLDVLAVGDDEATDPRRARAPQPPDRGRGRRPLGTAAAVSVSGPHRLRRDHRAAHRAAPGRAQPPGRAAAVDAVRRRLPRAWPTSSARTLSSPAEIPIGVVTAFFGAPFFVLVLRSSRRIGVDGVIRCDGRVRAPRRRARPRRRSTSTVPDGRVARRSSARTAPASRPCCAYLTGAVAGAGRPCTSAVATAAQLTRRERAQLVALVPQQPVIPDGHARWSTTCSSGAPRTSARSAWRARTTSRPSTTRSTDLDLVDFADRGRGHAVGRRAPAGARSPGRWPRAHRSCCSTSPPPPSTSATSSRCSSWSTTSAASTASP